MIKMTYPYQEKEPLLSDSDKAKSKDSAAQNGQDCEYRTTPMRWAVLFSVASMFLTKGLVNMAFAPVAIQIAQAYNLSSTVMVNMCAMSFALLSPPSDFLAVYLFGRYKTDTVLRIASLISFSGAMLRFLSLVVDEFWPILLGTFLMASVGSIFLNS